MGFALLNPSYALAAIGAELNETPLTPRRVLAAIAKARRAAVMGAEQAEDIE